jgi:hypothetical protein
MHKSSFTITLLILAAVHTANSPAADGLFNRPVLNSLKTTLEGEELIVRVPLVATETPKALGAFLYDSPKGSEAPITLYITLEKLPPKHWKPVLVLGDTTVLEPVLEDVGHGCYPSLSFGVRHAAKAMELLLAVARMFDQPLGLVRDLRLTDAQRAQKAEVSGTISPGDVEEIRELVYGLGRLAVIHDFLRQSNRKGRDEALSKWPGRHPFSVGGGERGSASYYAPNCGYQLEKQQGKWTVVGG